MKISDFGPPTYPADGHAILVRFGQEAWQTQVCIDGVWLITRSVTLTSDSHGPNGLLLDIPIAGPEFRVDFIPPA